jgi:DNA uptake protein ComE-like DNA-binding protein
MLKKAVKNFLQGYFTFTKGERQAISILSLLIIVSILIPYLGLFTKKDPIKMDATAFEEAIRKLDSVNSIPIDKPTFSSYKKKTEQFDFEPNATSEDAFIRLGFKPWIARRMVLWRDKGMKFRYKDDLLKVYGTDSFLITKLWEYIDLPEKAEKMSTPEHPTKKISYSSTKTIIDLNGADTNDLKSLYGIGTVLSKRIVAYRNSLGGFYSLDQLLEVYGFKEETRETVRERIQLVQPVSFLKLNLLTYKELAQHPYIDIPLAKNISNYRSQHGDFKSKEDLLKLKLMTPEVLQKLEPYLSFEGSDPAGRN